MRKKIFSWLGREFISLSSEAQPAESVAEETHELFRRFQEQLSASGLSLENTVRTRMWARDRESRNLATAARAKILTGKSKAASSSYISVGHLESSARVALDLLAMRPSSAAADKEIFEFDPPKTYISHIRYNGTIVISGFTSEADHLEEQVPEIFATLQNVLAGLSSSWAQVVKVSIFLNKTQNVETLKTLFTKINKVELAKIEFASVDGFSREQSLLEAEVTALIGDKH